ncbi:HECT-domain-containing protein [Mycena epipterygia]|nr:HECT-domain-containing protein [Mycena epipterygia]
MASARSITCPVMRPGGCGRLFAVTATCRPPLMYPLLGDEKRRNVNLGGRSGPNHATVIGEAKSLRSLRQDQKLQLNSAVCLQARWRGILSRRLVHSQIRAIFEDDVLGISGLRCLALLGEEKMLAKWSTAVLSGGEGGLFLLAQEPHRNSWLILIRKVAWLLINSAATASGPTKLRHLKILNLLLVPVNMRRHIGECDPILWAITSYLCNRDCLRLVSECLRSIPVQSKADSCLPLMVPLVTAPFEIYGGGSFEYAQAFTSVVVHILTIPLLPNRIPIASLTALSSKLPLSAFHLLDESHSFLDLISSEGAVHLLANLLAFTPPRYAKLSNDSLSAYLRFLTSLLNVLPTHTLDASTRHLNSWQQIDGSDSEPDVDDHAEGTPLEIDARTLKRLETLPSSAHVASLLCLMWNTKTLMGFIIALTAAWPSKKTDIMAAVLAYPGAGAMYVTQIHHEHIRDSVIGQNGRENEFTDPAHAGLIPAFVLMLDLYTQALATMGDDEFFSVTQPSTMSSASRNPLSVDELIIFSRQLLKVVWTLYFSLNPENSGNQKGGGSAVRRKSGKQDWIQVRDKSVKCLLAIHTRDSRRPFTPEGHWQECTNINLQAFVEVAAREEEQVALTTESLSPRELAYFSPRLGILHNIPFAIPFFTRVTIFQRFIATNKDTFRMNNPGGRRSNMNLTIRRDHLAQDGFDQLQDADLRGHISVTFIDKLGIREGNAGHRGLYKEFFTAICKEVFDSQRGLWFSNEKHEIYPSPRSQARTPENLKWFRFVGRILGKAIYDGILIDFAFAGFFLAKWLGRQGYLDDLASLDPGLYKGLIFLKHYAGDVEDLSLNFTANVNEAGTPRTIELLPDGNNIAVTKENRLQYIYLISHFRLSRQIKLQSEAFFQGLSEIIDQRWLRMFNQQELQTLLGGADSGIDVDDLRAHTRYDGSFKDGNDPTIVAFWNVVHTFDQKQRRALLHFVTSCSRPPLMGFKHLRPAFNIHDSDTEEHLPGAATCSNLLLLPRYKDEAVLKEKLLKAIMAESGF